MKKKLFIGLFVIVTGLFYGCVKDLHNSGISEATLLKGRVLEESEREPLVNVRVTVTNGTTDYTSTKTDNEGSFELTVNYNNFDGGNYLFLDAGSSGITKKVDLKGMGQESYNYGDIFLYNKNDGATPTITTSAIKDITSNGAVCGGNITSDGGAEVTQRGLCWSKTENPAITNSTVLCGTGIGEFTGALTGLTPNTKYHVRAFATNSIGTAYGEDREFTTADEGSVTKPTVSTNSISSISSNTAECGGNVTSDGGSDVTERGVCWSKASTTHNPTISNYSVKDSGAGTGSYSCTMNGLTENTEYFVRAYAKNAVGISYGDPVQFTTLSGGSGHSAPTVQTGIVTNISYNTATCSGIVTSDGGGGVFQRGICWGTSPNPVQDSWSNTAYDNGGETGTFTCNLSYLSANTTYYVRAFARNNIGVSYGDNVEFTTLDQQTYPPEVRTWTVDYNSNNNTASCKGMLVSAGSAPVTACGFCWGTTQNVTIENNPNVVNGNVPTGSLPAYFTCTISGFVSGTTYYVRAFATNGHGTEYGDPKQLVVSGGGSAPSAPTGVSATVIGSQIKISWNGVSNAETYSVHWSNTSGGSYIVLGTTSDLFYYDGSPIEDNYYKVKAINSYGESPFSSPAYCHYSTGGGGATTPTVTTTTPSNITTNSATCGGNVTSDGGATVTQRGICYNTSHNPTTSSSVVPSGSGTGSFTCNLTGLNPNTTYYVRAFAVNSEGTSYGTEKYFETNSEPVINGVLHYDDGKEIAALGFEEGGTLYWANMFPSSMLSQYVGTSIVEIRALLNSTGTYTLRIYSGGTSSPGSLVAVFDFNHSYSNFGWYYMTLPSSVLLDTSQNLWIVLSKAHSAGESPAGVCADSGNPNGRWVSDGSGTWEDLAAQSPPLLYSWGIHTFVSNQTKSGKHEKHRIISAQIKGIKIPNP